MRRASIPQHGGLYCAESELPIELFLKNFIAAINRLPLSQQLALTACVCCLVATLALVALAARSSEYTQENLQGEYGRSVAEQLARRLSSELAVGDRLGVAGELNRLVDQASITAARALDIEGNELAVAGDRNRSQLSFQANIFIAGDAAGVAEVTVDTSTQDSAQLQFVLALSGLAVLLSIAVYAVTRTMAQRLARNIRAVSAELAAVTGDESDDGNELQALQQRVAALPLDLLKPQLVGDSKQDHYVDTAILFIYFRSLPGYLETIDERRLQRYVAVVHRMIYGAAGFYGGELEVVRQFGLAVYFHGAHKIGSPALRAASCAWLIQQAAPDVESQLRLSVNPGLAVGGSELGRGDARDIYPGLYTQSSLDELLALARSKGPGIAVSDFAAKDIDLGTRIDLESGEDHIARVGQLADGHRDLLERQLQILLKALVDQAPEGGNQSD